MIDAITTARYSTTGRPVFLSITEAETLLQEFRQADWGARGPSHLVAIAQHVIAETVGSDARFADPAICETAVDWLVAYAQESI